MNRLTIFLLCFATTFCFCTSINGQTLKWQTDLEASKSRALEENKLILLHFSADWCRPCKELEKFVFSSPRVVAKIQQHLIPLHIDTDLHPELVKQFAITEIPSDVVITTNGRVVSKRKSPKTTDDYIRMVDSLPAGEMASQQQNLELTQKIDQVLSAANAGQVVSKSNDFVPGETSPKGPSPSQEGNQLKATTKLVSHQSSQDFDSSKSDQDRFLPKVVSRSKRVINDTFFVEKSALANASETGNGFVQRSMDAQKSKASISGANENDLILAASKDSAAKILAPELGHPAVQQNSFVGKHEDAANIFVAPTSSKLTSQSTELKVQPQEDSESAVNSLLPRTNETTVFALAGKCPVTLVQDGKWIDGDAKFGCVHRGRTYLFADSSKLAEFQKNPDSFSPVLAGYDPVLFHEDGQLVDGDAKHGVFMGKAPYQRIVLFSNQDNRNKFQAEPQKFMKTVRLAVEQANKNMK